MTQPLELVMIGADDKLVIQCSCQRDTKGDIELCAMQGTTKLSARFPLTATVTDANGEILEQDHHAQTIRCAVKHKKEA